MILQQHITRHKLPRFVKQEEENIKRILP